MVKKNSTGFSGSARNALTTGVLEKSMFLDCADHVRGMVFREM